VYELLSCAAHSTTRNGVDRGLGSCRYFLTRTNLEDFKVEPLDVHLGRAQEQCPSYNRTIAQGLDDE
jgi:hypothetical protein